MFSPASDNEMPSPGDAYVVAAGHEDTAGNHAIRALAFARHLLQITTDTAALLGQKLGEQLV